MGRDCLILFWFFWHHTWHSCGYIFDILHDGYTQLLCFAVVYVCVGIPKHWTGGVLYSENCGSSDLIGGFASTMGRRIMMYGVRLKVVSSPQLADKMPLQSHATAERFSRENVSRKIHGRIRTALR